MIINGRYQLQQKIGEGGMGAVYRAFDRLTRETVALKQVIIAPEKLEQTGVSLSKAPDNLNLALAQEFQILAGLRHPHIVSVLDYGFDQTSQPYLTMTYLPNAQTILEAGQQQSVTQKLQLIQNLLQALAYLHRRGIMHRDLKPQNILVSNGVLRVLDFGLASSNTILTHTSGGTPFYTSPEVWREHPYTLSADLYAVGVIAYELLANEHPFAPINHSFLDRVLDNEPDPTKLQAPSAINEVIIRLLAKTPSARYPDIETTLAAWSQALNLPQPPENTAIRESYLQAATFVGREAEMKTLTEALAQAKSGPCTMWLIGGESGVGKSRLIEQFRIHALVSGWQVWRGQAIANGGISYQLWQKIIPRLALTEDLTQLEASVLHQISPQIIHLINEPILPSPQLQGVAEKQRLTTTLLNLLQRQLQPTLLLLEDLQWARASLDPIKQLLQNSHRSTGLMIVGTFRHDEHPTLLEELNEAHHLPLQRLSDKQIIELSQAMLGKQATYSPELVSLLTQETEGNTFFIVEVMRALAKEAGHLGFIGSMTLPTRVFTQGMQQILQRRIQQVSQADQTLLQLAAVAGRQLDIQLLQTLAKNDISNWLQRALETAILMVRDDQWLFAHDKLREAILADIDLTTKRDLHDQIALTIEQLYPNNDSYHQLLLQHWYEAGNREKELHYLLSVVRYLTKFTADYAHTHHLLERGLHLLPNDDSRRVEIFNLQSRIHEYQGNYEQSHQSAQAAHVLAQAIGNQAGIATSLYHMGTILRRQSEPQAVTYYQQSLAIWQTLNNEAGIAKCFNGLGLIALDLSDYETAINFFQQGLALQKKLQDNHGIGNMLHNLGLILSYQGHYDKAKKYFEQSLAIYQTVGDQRSIAYCYNGLGSVSDYLGAYETAQMYHQKSLAIRRAIGDRRSVAVSLHNLGESAMRQGNYGTARDYYTQSLSGFQEVGEKLGICHSLTNLGFVALQLGQKTAVSTMCQALTETHNIQATALALENIIHFSWLYLKTDKPIQAAKLVGLAQHHPARNSDVQIKINTLTPLLTTTMPPTDWQAAFKEGQQLDLNEVIQTLLDEFNQSDTI